MARVFTFTLTLHTYCDEISGVDGDGLQFRRYRVEGAVPQCQALDRLVPLKRNTSGRPRLMKLSSRHRGSALGRERRWFRARSLSSTGVALKQETRISIRWSGEGPRKQEIKRRNFSNNNRDFYSLPPATQLK